MQISMRMKYTCYAHGFRIAVFDVLPPLAAPPITLLRMTYFAIIIRITGPAL
jgi:hypothetical protein